MPVLTVLNSLPNDDFFFIWVRSCWGRIFWETNTKHCERPHCHLTRRDPKNKMQVRIAPAMLDFLGCIDCLGTVQLLGRESRDCCTASWEPVLFTLTCISAWRRIWWAVIEQGGKSRVSIQLGQILYVVKGPKQNPESAHGKAYGRGMYHA